LRGRSETPVRLGARNILYSISVSFPPFTLRPERKAWQVVFT
jgi:hypothetical protein